MERRRPRKPAARPLVFIVDGHEDTRDMYALGLASFGFEAVPIEDGPHAFERVWATRPDIIVTELALPQIDGWMLLDDLKRDPRTRDIPVVVLTARPEPSARERAGQLGCAAVLTKPYAPEDLAHALREVLVTLSLSASTSPV